MGELRRHRWTADDVLRMVEAGVLDEDAHVELIDGELIEMTPQGPLHRMSTVRIRRRLERAFGTGFYVQDHSPVDAGRDSMPEPDVAVVRGPECFDRHPGPDDVELVLELAYTSHAADTAKVHVYAAAGFRAYWLVDLVARRITVYSEPHVEDREYGLVAIYREADEVVVAGQPVPVVELLPPTAP